MPPTIASLVARDLIQTARDLHPSFDVRRHPDPVLLRALSRYQRRLATQMLLRNRRTLVVSLETALPLADFVAGITVPDYKLPVAVWALRTATGTEPDPKTEVELVGPMAAPRYLRAAYLQNNVLHLTGVPADWLEYSAIRFEYVPQLEALTTLGTTLQLPNAAEDALVAYLARVMAARGVLDEGVEKPNRAALDADWLQAQADFLDEVAAMVQVEIGVVREVF